MRKREVSAVVAVATLAGVALLGGSVRAASVDFSSTAPTAPSPTTPGTGLNGSINFDKGGPNAGSATYTAANINYSGNDSASVNQFLGTDSNSSSNTQTGAVRLGNASDTLTGYINIPSAGTYTFGTNSDDGSQLSIAGQQVVYNGYPNPQGPTEATGTATFSQPGLYPIEIDYVNNQYNNYTGGASLTVQEATGTTSSPGQISSTVLYQSVPAASTPLPASGLAGFALLGGLALARMRRKTC